jgi:hypothetical protein
MPNSSMHCFSVGGAGTRRTSQVFTMDRKKRTVDANNKIFGLRVQASVRGILNGTASSLLDPYSESIAPVDNGW